MNNKVSNVSMALQTITLVMFGLSFTTNAHAAGVSFGIKQNPGTYNIIDRADIEKYKIDWSRVSQDKDRETYQKHSNEAEVAYRNLYAAYQALNKLHIETVKASAGDKTVDILALGNLIADYKQKRDLFLQQIAAVEVTQSVWATNAASKQIEQTEIEMYRLGSLNLKAFADTYKEGIKNIDAMTIGLTYRYATSFGPQVTADGMGLEIPSATVTPDSLVAALQEQQKNLELSRKEKADLGLVSNELGRMMLGFVDTNATKLYWFNGMQKEDKEKWIESVETKARILKWVRAVYCMQIGVPVLDIPDARKFNLAYLTRGVPESTFRIGQKESAERDEQNIRKMISRFDEVFVSVSSQAGEYNNVGGIMGYMNRANSLLTWHNEIAAYLSIMKILRENMVDELDLAESAGAPEGCEKVRARYYARYGSIVKDTAFNQKVSAHLDGMNSSGSADRLQNAFKVAGVVIHKKGAFFQNLQKFLKAHPNVSLVNQAIENADGLK